MREEASMKSKRLGKLCIGDMLMVTERQRLPDGTMRVKTSQGWVSVISKKGDTMLELISEGEKSVPETAAVMLGDDCSANKDNPSTATHWVYTAISKAIVRGGAAMDAVFIFSSVFS